MLRLDHVEAGYGPTSCLNGVSLEVAQGEIVALLGANGAGKSTTLMALSGLMEIRSGTIIFQGTRLNGLPPERIVGLGISHVPEGRRILSSLTVLENLTLGAYRRRDLAAIRADFDRVFALFPILAERRRQLAGTLSGGEQQMLAIGRGLMARPTLLLLDEPSLGLAPKLVHTIFETITRINRDGVTLLLVEQNARLALQIAHRGYVLETGRIVLTDTAASLANNPQVKSAYLGG
ncbi:MAG: ABC transporter ATP-binding protein [Candidatus Omnitrophica bacterium]|nr:ABC transporter ATP-binding protein [Candidatus Omnitrophota bacterium]